MRVVKARSALLSDYEVLQLLQDAEAAQRKQNRGRTSDIDGAHDLEVPSNLRTVQFEVRFQTHPDNCRSHSRLPSLCFAER